MAEISVGAEKSDVDAARLDAADGTADFAIETSRHFVSWLSDVGSGLAFTTYQAGKLFMLGVKDDKLAVFERSLDRSMGLAVHERSLYISSLYQVWRFENLMEHGVTEGGFDACYSPQMSYVTGDLDIHDMAVDRNGELIFVNTLFGCLAKPSCQSSFVPVWQPSFLSALAAEDRCHLNGLAMRDGDPAYVTAVSKSDVVDGWRDHRVSGGIVMDVASQEVVASGLSMPHSPRLKDGTLYILNSGTGEFGTIDPESGHFTAITFCPGYARGLAFVGQHAVIGLSLPRYNRTFEGLPLDEKLYDKTSDARCGLIVVDLKTGEAVHWVRLEGVVTELYDVAVLPGVRNPSLIGFRSDDVRRVISIGARKSV